MMDVSRFLLLGLVLFSVSCTSVRYFEEINPQIDLAAYESFGMMKNPHLSNDAQAMRILGKEDFSQEMVRSIVEARGFRFVEKEKADFLIEVRAAEGVPELPYATHSSVRDGVEYAFFNLDAPWPEPPRDDTLKDDPNVRHQGVRLDHIAHSQPAGYFIIVEAFDAATGNRAWIGWARAHTEFAYRSDKARAKVIKILMNQF